MIACCLLLLVGAPPQGDLAQAKLFFESGKRAFQQGEYEAAIAAFEQAHEAAPRPALFFSMAQAYRLQFFSDGRIPGLQKAARLYARYLAEDPKGRRRSDAVEHLAAAETILVRRGAEAGAEEQAERKTQLMVSANVAAQIDFGGGRHRAPLIRVVEPGAHTATVSAPGYRSQTVRRVAVAGRLVVAHVELEELPARVTTVGAEAAELRIDGQRIGELPVTDVRLASGPHRFQILDRGKKPFDRTFNFQRGEEVRLTVELQNTGQRTASYWLLGAGGVGTGLGAVFLALALVAENKAVVIQNDLMNGASLSGPDINRFRGLSEERKDYTVTAAPLLATGGVTLIVGALLYLLDAPTVTE